MKVEVEVVLFFFTHFDFFFSQRKDFALISKEGSKTLAVSKVHRVISFCGLAAMVLKPPRI